MKKWLSYHERPLLGRDITMDEVDHVTQMARRIAAILLLSEKLDENYRACRDNAIPWQGVGEPPARPEMATMELLETPPSLSLRQTGTISRKVRNGKK